MYHFGISTPISSEKFATNKRPEQRQVFCLAVLNAGEAHFSFAETRPAIVTKGEYFSNNSKNSPILLQL